MATPKPDLHLYTSGTPNGQKISCTLEELGLPYTVHNIEISQNVQKEPWFLEINPNGRIPALIDRSHAPSPLRLFEGLPIQLYLATQHDPSTRLFFPPESPLYWEGLSWLTWLQSGIGPMQGQANHFHRYAPDRIEYAVRRYQVETARLYGVLEERLNAEKGPDGEGAWIVGAKFTIVDIAVFSWVNWAEWAGVKLEKFPEIRKWLGVINGREGIRKGLDVPTKFEMKEKMKTKAGEEEFAKHHSNWVMQGMKKDQESHQ